MVYVFARFACSPNNVPNIRKSMTMGPNESITADIAFVILTISAFDFVALLKYIGFRCRVGQSASDGAAQKKTSVVGRCWRDSATGIASGYPFPFKLIGLLSLPVRLELPTLRLTASRRTN